MAEQTVLELELLIAKYSRTMRTAMTDAKALDKALNELIATSKRVENALNGIRPDIKFTVDTSALDRAEGDIKALDGRDVEVEVSADTSKAESDIKAISDVAPDVDIDVTADTEKAKNDIKSIDNDAPDVDIDVTADTTDVKKELDDIENELKNLQTLAVLEIGFNIASSLPDMLTNVPFFGQIVELDSASKSVQGVERSLLSYQNILRSIQTSNYGESYQQIADAIEQIDIATKGTLTDTQLQDAVLSAFQVSGSTGEDLTSVIRTQAQLVNNDLVPSFRDAADIIQFGFNNGVNRSDDFLDTLYEYAPNFKQMGLDGVGALDLIIQAMDQGTFNTDKLGDAFKEAGILLDESIATNAGKTADALNELTTAGVEIDLAGKLISPNELQELFNQGEVSGIEFIEGITKGVNGAIESGKISEGVGNFNLLEIIGTPAEDLGIDLFKMLNFDVGGDQKIEGLEGAAENTANAVNDTLASSFEELTKTVSDALIPDMEEVQKIVDDITDKVQELTGLLKDGVALPEALAITLDMPELATTLRNMESAFGNFLIGILEAVASIQDLTGNDSSGTRQFIGQLAGNQLGFDLKLQTDAEGVQQTISTALMRGVDEAAIDEALKTSLSEMVSAGDFDLARQIAESIATEAPQQIAILNDVKYPISIDPELSGADLQAEVARQVLDASGDIQAFNQALAGMFTLEGSGVDTELTSFVEGLISDITAITEQNNEVSDAKLLNLNYSQESEDLATLQGDFETTGTAATDLSTTVSTETSAVSSSVSTMGTDVSTGLEGVSSDLVDAEDSFETFKTNVTEDIMFVGGAWAQMVFDVAAQKESLDGILQDAKTDAASVGSGGGGGGTFDAKDNAQGGFNPANIPFTWNPNEELAISGADVTILNQQTSSALMTAMSALGMGGGSTTYNSINITQNFNNSNDARSRNNANIASRILNGVG